MKPKHNCKNCKDRERIMAEFGNCHNEHCPNGWLEYEEEKQIGYKNKVKVQELKVIHSTTFWKRNRWDK